MANRGEIYFVNLNPTTGREQAGDRPVLVVSSDRINRLPLVVTVVAGTKGENVARDFQSNVRVSAEESGLPLETVFMCFQLRSLDASRFPTNSSGKLSEATMLRVEDAIRYALDL